MTMIIPTYTQHLLKGQAGLPGRNLQEATMRRLENKQWLLHGYTLNLQGGSRNPTFHFTKEEEEFQCPEEARVNRVFVRRTS